MEETTTFKGTKQVTLPARQIVFRERRGETSKVIEIDDVHSELFEIQIVQDKSQEYVLLRLKSGESLQFFYKNYASTQS